MAYLTYGGALIAQERERQIEQEGWTLAHDDTHVDGALAMAASCLAADGTDAEFTMPNFEQSWIAALWRKHRADRQRQLVVAGALIAAEIDRLHRQLHRQKKAERA